MSDLVGYEYALARPASMPDMSGRETFMIVSGGYDNLAFVKMQQAKHARLEGELPFIVRRKVTPWERNEAGDE